MARSQAKTIERTEVRYPDRFKIIMWNDDFTPMDFVVQLLVELFDRPLNEAKTIMIDIHEDGKGIAGEYNFEIAEKGILTTEFKTERLFLNYQKIHNHYLVYVCK